VCLLWVVSGCATSYPVKVEAFSSGRPSPGLSYRIQLKGVSPDGVVRLRETEAATYVRTALSGRGFYEAPSADRADVVIEVEFGIEPVRGRDGPDRVPIYAELAGGVRRETVTVTDPQGRISLSKTIAIFAQIAVLFHFGRSFDELIEKPESLLIVLAFLIAPDIMKKALTLKLGGK
jgi:hypothetical protein